MSVLAATNLNCRSGVVSQALLTSPRVGLVTSLATIAPLGISLTVPTPSGPGQVPPECPLVQGAVKSCGTKVTIAAKLASGAVRLKRVNAQRLAEVGPWREKTVASPMVPEKSQP